MSEHNPQETKKEPLVVALPANSAFAKHPELVKHADFSPEKTLPETKGERGFRLLRFWIAEVVVLALTAAIAYSARYNEAGTISKISKKLEGLAKQVVGTDETTPHGRLGKSFADAMVTFHGGNVFAPFLYAMERKKGVIVNFINERFGTPEEVEIGKLRVENEPKPSFLSVLKGRLVAFAIVFSSFSLADQLLGYTTDPADTGKKIFRFNKYVDNVSQWFGEKFGPTGIDYSTITDETIKDAPKSYKLGGILALDVYATTAAITIWTAFNKIFARREDKAKSDNAPRRMTAVEMRDVVEDAAPQKSFTHEINPRYADGFVQGLQHAAPQAAGIGVE